MNIAITVILAAVAILGALHYFEQGAYAYFTYRLNGEDRIAFIGRREAVAAALYVEENAIMLQDNRIMFAVDRKRAMERHPAGGTQR